MFLRANVTHKDSFLHSSDVDFASEYGFATDGAAYTMIEQAMHDAGLV